LQFYHKNLHFIIKSKVYAIGLGEPKRQEKMGRKRRREVRRLPADQWLGKGGQGALRPQPKEWFTFLLVFLFAG